MSLWGEFDQCAGILNLSKLRCRSPGIEGQNKNKIPLLASEEQGSIRPNITRYDHLLTVCGKTTIQRLTRTTRP